MFRSRTRRGRQDGGVCDHGKPSAVAIPQNSDVSHLVRIDDDVAATVQPQVVALQHFGEIDRSLVHVSMVSPCYRATHN